MLNKKALAASLSAPPATYVEDVFSTYLYTGNGTSQTITNGIDLSGEGGLVWCKNRTTTSTNNILTATPGKALISNLTNSEATTTRIAQFNSDGFFINNSSTDINENGNAFVSWTFRKAEKFFDVVTYTGNGTAGRTVSHNLGSVPGCIIVKCTSEAQSWAVYHRSLGNDKRLILQTTTAATTTTTWNSTDPTSTVFSVDDGDIVNKNGATYVAYLFAHDAGGFGDSGSESVIKCGSFTASGPSSVNLGWEPQYLLMKNASATSNWFLIDSMRGWFADTSADSRVIIPNSAGSESFSAGFSPTATGFKYDAGSTGNTWIYIAIRRGPMKTPEAGTEVFAPLLANTSAPTFRGSFPIDLIIDMQRLGGTHYAVDRLRGSTRLLATTSTAAEATNANYKLDYQTSAFSYASDPTYEVGEAFRRAPGFMDVVCYTGNGTAGLSINHNLTVVPEMMIVKSRDQTTRNWGVYHVSQGNSKAASLNTTTGFIGIGTDIWNSQTPTSSVFYVGDGGTTNTAGSTYVAYLFASVAGVSKVGSYTGTGTTQQINCGFTGGARFVLIKRADDVGDWYVWDTARGIVSGNDPYLLMNSTAAEVTNTDYIDTYSQGFEISSTAPAAINANGGTFIYLAIA